MIFLLMAQLSLVVCGLTGRWRWVAAVLFGLATGAMAVVGNAGLAPGIETRAAIAFLVELQRLDHRAHGAVEHENALPHQIEEFGAGAGGGGVRHAIAHTQACSLFPLGRGLG